MLHGQRWMATVEAEHAQSERMRGGPPPEDHWEPYAQQFRADPHRTDDPLLDRLLEDVAPHHVVIDVGAGGGRLALPLALRCQHVTAVEPSPSMASVLLQQASDHGIHNVSLVQSRWEEAELAPGDIVICIHVIYTVRNIEQFVRKLESHARERVLIVLFKSPPQSQIYPLWERIHGEKRLQLPGLPQLEEVLRQLGIDAQVEMLHSQGPRGFDSLDQAKEQLSQRLYLAHDNEKISLLESLLPDLLEEEDGIFRIKGAGPLEPALVWWRPTYPER